jgi:hypothetical protein
MAGSLRESIVTRHTLHTLASDRVLAIDILLFQTSPRFGKSLSMFESWCPLYVRARSVCLLRRTFVKIAGFLNTDIIVDCESSRIQLGSMPQSLMIAQAKRLLREGGARCGRYAGTLAGVVSKTGCTTPSVPATVAATRSA